MGYMIANEIRRINKNKIYDVYDKLVEYRVDYNKITREEMLNKIIENYDSNPEIIIQLCTLEELIFLKDHIDNDITYDIMKAKYEDEVIINSLVNKFLLFHFFDKNKFIVAIPEEMLNPIKRALNILDVNEKCYYDYVETIIIGLFRIYNYVTRSEFYKLFSLYENSLKEEELLEYIDNNKRLENYIGEVKIDYKGIKDVRTYVSLEYFLIDEIVQSINTIEMKPKIYSPISVVSIGKYGFDITDDVIAKLYYYMKLSGYTLGCGLVIKDIVEAAGMGVGIDCLINNLSRICDIRSHSGLEEQICEVLDRLPNWLLSGNSKYSLRGIKKADKIIKKDSYGHLSVESRDLFYKLYFELLTYVNVRYKINKKIGSLVGKVGINPEDILPIRKKLWSDIKIIDDYVKENPYKLNKEEIAIIIGFKKHVTGDFVVVKYKKKKAIFCYMKKGLSKQICYLVSGITGNIEDIIPDASLPLFVSATLIPFRDRIIYDSNFESLPLVFGPGMKQMVNEELKKATILDKLK